MNEFFRDMLKEIFSRNKTPKVALIHLTRQILPLCEWHATVTDYVDYHSTLDKGKIQHALCAAVDNLVQEYRLKIGQLESLHREDHHSTTSNGNSAGGGATSNAANNFTLHRLWYLLQPSFETMSQLAAICTAVYGKSGGSLLRALEAVMQGGRFGNSVVRKKLAEHCIDRKGTALYFSFMEKCRCCLSLCFTRAWMGMGFLILLQSRVLTAEVSSCFCASGSTSAPNRDIFFCDNLQGLAAATVPFFDMLADWLEEGKLTEDVYDEFFVKKNPQVSESKFGPFFWHNRYYVEPSLIPGFLLSLKDRILKAGKYKKVLNDCIRIKNEENAGRTHVEQDAGRMHFSQRGSSSRAVTTFSSRKNEKDDNDNYTGINSIKIATSLMTSVSDHHDHPTSKSKSRTFYYTKSDSFYIQKVTKFYQQSSKQLLQYFLHDLKLKTRLRVFRALFFLEKADWVSILFLI